MRSSWHKITPYSSLEIFLFFQVPILRGLYQSAKTLFFYFFLSFLPEIITEIIILNAKTANMNPIDTGIDIST